MAAGLESSRRAFLAGAGTLLIGAQIGGALRLVTPAEAAASKAPFRSLSERQAGTLSALADTIVPGSAEAGVAHFIDHHISVPASESLLILRYLDVAPPYAAFYTAGLKAVDAALKAEGAGAFSDLGSEARARLVGAMLSGKVPGWPAEAPPPFFFYFVLRSDSVDVAYGTRRGFERLGVPYLGHIDPETAW